MEKYLLNMPKELKEKLTVIGKKDGYTLNAQILFILWSWIKDYENQERSGKGV